jgi:sugar phosphate isomerase/epimerase
MRLSLGSPIHLAYCQNIHPGEAWEENLQALREKALGVRELIAPGDAFGLGLRLGSRAAEDLRSPGTLEEGRAFFREQNVYPFTVNGFPFGRFHRGPVKEQVYAPDWRTPQRLEYTCAIADALEFWLPDAGEASISTVPGSYAAWIREASEVEAMARSLAQCVAHLARIEREKGKFIHLGLEPEPDCFLETTAQTVDFFENALPQTAVPALAGALQLSPAQAEETLRRHLGVCFDTCHIALQFEGLAHSLTTLEKAGIKISKIQLSAALKTPASREGINALRNFQEPTYLHQVKGRTTDGALRAWADLPPALEQAPGCTDLEELRVHFHVPLFFAPRAPLQSTRDALDSAFWQKIHAGICPHLEIETYTFDVLPPEAHPGDVLRSIAEEYRWVLSQLETADNP